MNDPQEPDPIFRPGEEDEIADRLRRCLRQLRAYLVDNRDYTWEAVGEQPAGSFGRCSHNAHMAIDELLYDCILVPQIARELGLTEAVFNERLAQLPEWGDWGQHD